MYAMPLFEYYPGYIVWLLIGTFFIVLCIPLASIFATGLHMLPLPCNTPKTCGHCWVCVLFYTLLFLQLIPWSHPTGSVHCFMPYCKQDWQLKIVWALWCLFADFLTTQSNGDVSSCKMYIGYNKASKPHKISCKKHWATGSYHNQLSVFLSNM